MRLHCKGLGKKLKDRGGKGCSSTAFAFAGRFYDHNHSQSCQ